MNMPNIKVKTPVWVLLISLLFVPCAFSVSPCQLALDGDLNQDCKVNMVDLSWFASVWLSDQSGQTGAFLPDGTYVMPPEWGGYDHRGCGSMIEPSNVNLFI